MKVSVVGWMIAGVAMTCAIYTFMVVALKYL